MGRKTAKRSAIAIVSACVWALFALFAHMVARPAGKAHAAIDDVITVYALNIEESVEGSDDVYYEWGTFYRGVKTLDALCEEEMAYESAAGSAGNMEIKIDSENDNSVIITTEFVRGDALNEGYEYGKHVHDFTAESNGEWEEGEGENHWAVCDCGFRLSVPHRLSKSGDGTCADCGVTLDGYENTYTFLVPETLPGEGGEWTEENVATIEIPVNATLFFGFTLTLYLNCDGTLTSEEMGETVSYTIAVSYAGNASANGVECLTPSCDGSDEAVWVYTSSEEDNTDEGAVMAVMEGTITITLTVDIDSALSDLTYAGDFTGELTFSATLEEAN